MYVDSAKQLVQCQVILPYWESLLMINAYFKDVCEVHHIIKTNYILVFLRTCFITNTFIHRRFIKSRNCLWGFSECHPKSVSTPAKNPACDYNTFYTPIIRIWWGSCILSGIIGGYTSWWDIKPLLVSSANISVQINKSSTQAGAELCKDQA